MSIIQNNLKKVAGLLIHFSKSIKGVHNYQYVMPASSHLLYSTVKDWNSCVVLTNNGQTICCWHPEEAPSYEHTRPLPEIEPELREGDSVLKLQYRRDAKYRFQPDGPTNEELAKMTYTTKHRWFPNNEKKYLDPNPPVDREGI